VILIYAPLFFALLGLKASAEPVVRVLPHVVVLPQTRVTLANIVDGHDLSKNLISKLNEVSLARAPGLGEKVELTQAAAMEALRPLVMEERRRTGKSVRLIVPNNIMIGTERREMTLAQVTSELAQAWQPLCGDCEIEFEGLSLPRVENMRHWTMRIKSDLPRGSFSVPVDLGREDGSSASAWVSGRIVVKKRVPVAKRILQVGERVQPDDFSWEYKDVSYSIDGIPEAHELAGKRVKNGLRAGDVLWTSSLEKEKAVRRGDLIQVRSRSDGWEVSLNVIAEADAYVGDVINLKNPKTNSVLIGQVTGRGEVELR
jgi:flagella basal body P-ring formation protein FlgA